MKHESLNALASQVRDGPSRTGFIVGVIVVIVVARLFATV